MEEMTIEGYLQYLVELMERNNQLLECMVGMMASERTIIDMMDGRDVQHNATMSWECGEQDG